MLVPLEWLKEYTDINVDLDTYLSRMVLCGVGVESVEELGADISGVVTGKVIKMEKHPDADRLQVCIVDVGGSVLQVVTGADNVFEGAVVPVATHGARLPGGKTIKKGKMRGVASEGMLCSGTELQLTDADVPGAEVDGILILPAETAVGRDIADVLGTGGVVVDFEVYANRPDRQSVIGIARETAAALETPLRLPEISVDRTADATTPLTVEVKDPDLCPRYMACVVRNVRIAPSPAWMQKHLRQAGVRPINNIVDVTNYVMLEMGQPMHAFDLACVHDDTIIVRRAQEGETIATLDGKERVLKEGMLLIADPAGPIGIAGVMGGANSEIKDTTRDIVLESACFLPASVRATSKALGLNTESAARFIKGVDIRGTENALERAAQLICMLDAGEVAAETTDILNADMAPRTVTVRADEINALLGLALSPEEMAALLKRTFIPAEVRGDMLVCEVPDFRQDLERPCDIAEEVARMYGYDRIPMTLMRGDLMVGNLGAFDRQADRAKERLCALGFYEAQTYSFTGPRDYDALGLSQDHPLRLAVPLANPFGEDQSLMRTTMLPGMLRALALNIARKNTELALYEVGAVFLPKALPVTELPDERQTLCLGLYGPDEDFFTLKGIVESLADCLNIDAPGFTAEGPEYLHPGQKAAVWVNGQAIGHIGCLHPDVCAAFDIPGRAYVGELDWTALISAAGERVTSSPLPRYPAVERDLALVMDMGQEAGPVVEMMKKAGGALLESAAPFDVYTGGQVGADKKSVAFSLVFRAKDRTLTDQEIAALIEKMVAKAEKEFGAKLR
jgi:phenylalanyl-tRNA synthetase beta chain